MYKFVNKHKKFCMVLLCFMLVFCMFFGGVTQVYAFAPAIPIAMEGLAILGGFLTAIGFVGITSSNVNTAWSRLPPTEQGQLISASASMTAMNEYNMACVNLPSTLWNDLLGYFGSGSLPSDFQEMSAYTIEGARANYDTLADSVFPAMVTTYGNAYYVGMSDGWIYANAYVYGTSEPMRGDKQEDGSIWLSTAGTAGYQYIHSDFNQYAGGNTPGMIDNVQSMDGHGTTITVLAGGTSDSAYRFINGTTSIPIYVAGVLTGYLGDAGAGTGGSYDFVQGYNSLATGDKTIAMPLHNGPDTSAPYTGNPITLNDVIDGYGSMQQYLDAGGVITLNDGTTIGGTNALQDISNTDVQKLQDAVLGQTSLWDKIRAGVSSIGATLSGAISGLLTGVWTGVTSLSATMTDAWDWVKEWATPKDDEWSLNFDAFKNVPLADKFPFCIPFDFYNCIAVWSASPVDYQLNVDLDTKFLVIHKEIDLSPFQWIFQFFRGFCIIFFSYILIVKTRSLIKW